MSTATAPSSPASRQAAMSRFTSEKPEKRHIPWGTRSSTKTLRYSATKASMTQTS